MRRIARQHVTSRVQEELDATVESKLKLANQQFQSRVLEPLKGLSLEPAVAAMHTNEERVTVRMRVAADEQLAACTPRPQALADSLASLQVHQSLLNNVVQRLELDGRSFTLPDLQRHLAHALSLDPKNFSEEYPRDMRIEFARDAVQVRFVNGRVEITLTVAELRKRPSSWRDFKVRVYYKPVRRGMDLRFVRDGTVQLWGERFGAQPQIALRHFSLRILARSRIEPDRCQAGPRPPAGRHGSHAMRRDRRLARGFNRPAPHSANRPQAVTGLHLKHAQAEWLAARRGAWPSPGPKSVLRGSARGR